MSSRTSATARNTSPGSSGTTRSSRSARVVIAGTSAGASAMSVGRIALATMPATARIVTGIRKSVRSVRSESGRRRARAPGRRSGGVDVGELDDVAGGVLDEGGAHGHAEVLAARSAAAGTRRRALRRAAIVSSHASAGMCSARCGKPARAPISSTRAEVHLRGSELQPGALGAGAEVGAGELR